MSSEQEDCHQIGQVIKGLEPIEDYTKHLRPKMELFQNLLKEKSGLNEPLFNMDASCDLINSYMIRDDSLSNLKAKIFERCFDLLCDKIRSSDHDIDLDDIVTDTALADVIAKVVENKGN